MIAFMTCSITKIVTPLRLIERMSSMAFSISEEFRPAMTSSRKRSRGSMARAFASSSLLRSGIVRSVAVRSRLSASWTRSRTSSAWARAWAAVRRCPPAPNIAPVATFSRTVSWRRGLTTWNVRAIPSRPIR